MQHQVQFSCGCERALDIVEGALTGRGLGVFRSFDLPGAGACGCSSGPEQECACRFAVLLVYADSGLPAVVTAVGHIGRTLVEVATDPNAAVDPGLVDETVRAIRAVAVERSPYG